MSELTAHIAGIRKDYQKAALDETVAGQNPLVFFGQWFGEAEKAGADEVNAMTLATVDEAGRPHARIVLLKGLDDRGFVFYTNYKSAKGREMETNAAVALVFFWKELERQVRVEGVVEKVTEAESDAYFRSRPFGSRIGAWASPQSQRLADRSSLEKHYEELARQWEGQEPERPDYWGGYRVLPQKIEFWQGRSSRLHDRLVFEQKQGTWERYRLAP